MPDWFPTNLDDALVFTPLRILFLIVVAIIARTIICGVVRRSIKASIDQPGKERLGRVGEKLERLSVLPQRRREQRLLALGTLVRNIVTVVIAVITLFAVLSELHFNITSLVAGTSIVAVTIAFGLQNVVKDLVSGVFILIEDQLGVGDWVTMDQAGGSASGQVIEVGLRITRLKLHDGTVCAVRNGELLRVTNFSQGGPDRLPESDEIQPEAQAGPGED